MSFKRTVKDFICAHCGASVEGDGYTNHCPKCLWSKHVDTNPGDRAAACGGLMEPIRLEGASKYRIVHRCQKCKLERAVNVAKNDDVKAVLALAGNQ